MHTGLPLFCYDFDTLHLDFVRTSLAAFTCIRKRVDLRSPAQNLQGCPPLLSEGTCLGSHASYKGLILSGFSLTHLKAFRSSSFVHSGLGRPIYNAFKNQLNRSQFLKHPTLEN